MTLVVDASIAVKWLYREPGSDAALRLIGRDTLVAPDLIVAEVANALWRLTRVAELARPLAAEGIAELLATIDELHPLAALAGRATEIAVAADHPVYDCFYLALAEKLETRLITADRKLTEKLTDDLRRRVEVLG